MSRVYNTKDFIEKANCIHNNKYDYSQVLYETSHKKIKIICPVHGEFWQTPSNHLHKKAYGCTRCGIDKNSVNNTINNDIIIEKFKKKYGDKYDYSKVRYEHWKKPVIIICPVHGEFKKRAYNFLAGQECQKCTPPHGGIYNEKYFKKYPERKDRESTLYFIEFIINEVKYLKIGITSSSDVIKEYLNPKYKSYSYKVLKEKKLTLYLAYRTEKHILDKFKSISKFPDDHQGRTECFDYTEDNKNLIIKEIENFLSFPSSTWCILPWIHLSTRPDGSMRVCCTANASSVGPTQDKKYGGMVRCT